ncbi:uncharacterized protein V6R79_002450 [Siganus canaliculatus]
MNVLDETENDNGIPAEEDEDDMRILMLMKMLCWKKSKMIEHLSQKITRKDQSLDSFGITECSSLSEAFTAVSPASDTWSCLTQTGQDSSSADIPDSSRGTNIPEETDSSEFFDMPQPLVTSKSLPYSQVNDANYTFSDMCNFHSY